MASVISAYVLTREPPSANIEAVNDAMPSLPLGSKAEPVMKRRRNETSGERFVGELPRAVVKIVDVKCPGSGEAEKFCFENLAALEPKDQIKFVILDERDYLYARDFLEEHRLRERVDEIIFSPVFGQLHPRQLAEWILRDGLEVRLGLQLHKFIWDPQARGV